MDMPGPGIRFISVSPQKQDLQVILASWFPDHVGKNTTAILHTDDCKRPTKSLCSVGSNSQSRQHNDRSASRQSSRISTLTVMHYRPVVGHRFELDMGQWGKQPCEVVAVQPERLLGFRFPTGTLDTMICRELIPELGRNSAQAHTRKASIWIPHLACRRWKE